MLFRAVLRFGFEQQHTQIWHKVDRHQPAQHQCNHRHRKNCKGVFTGDRFGNANWQEADGGNERTGQHRHGGDFIGKGRGAHLVVAFFHLAHHHLHGDDGVIHQQPQRDDERAQRYFVQPDAEVRHPQKGHRQHQRDGDTHHQTGAHVDVPTFVKRVIAGAAMETQRDKADRQDDGDRFNQGADKLIDRIGHVFGLVLNLQQADACGQGLFNLAERGFQGFAQCDDVAAFAHADAQSDDFFALVVHFHHRRIGVAAFDLGKVTQTDLAARAATYRHGAQFFNRFKLPGHPHLHNVQRRLYCAGRFHRVLLANLRQHLVEVQAKLRQTLL